MRKNLEHNQESFTQKEIEKLWSVLEEKEFAGIILFMIFTGCRVDEFINLKHEHVDWVSKIITIPDYKHNAVRVVPIDPTIMSIVLERYDADSNDFLFLDSHNEQYTKNSLRFDFTSFLQNMGMKHRMYETRHTFIEMFGHHYEKINY